MTVQIASARFRSIYPGLSHIHPEVWLQPRIAMNMPPNKDKTYIKEYDIY